MTYKRIDTTRPRCPECNEPFTKKELKRLDKKHNNGLCDNCRFHKDDLIYRKRYAYIGELFY